MTPRVKATAGEITIVGLSAFDVRCYTGGKRTGLTPARRRWCRAARPYDVEVIEVAIVVNSLLSTVPMNRMAATATIEMHAARSAYSMRS